MRHCPRCERAFAKAQDICPDCWELLSDGQPVREARLSLVYTSTALYEAEMIETLLRNEGIPCLKIPGYGAILWPLASSSPLTLTRLYVHTELAQTARELIAEVTGGGETTGG